jgi:hypothetical protein
MIDSSRMTPARLRAVVARDSPLSTQMRPEVREGTRRTAGLPYGRLSQKS